MNGRSHRLVAAGSWMYAAVSFGAPMWQVATGVPFAVALSSGSLSPDADNARTWKRLDGLLPDELLGEGGPLGHRQLLHWWGIPAIAALLVWMFARDASLVWMAWAGITGWSSHLAGDFFCGRAGYGTRKGIPLGPWWWHVGLGLKSGGRTERWLVPVAFAAVLWIVASTPGYIAAGVATAPPGRIHLAQL